MSVLVSRTTSGGVAALACLCCLVLAACGRDTGPAGGTAAPDQPQTAQAEAAVALPEALAEIETRARTLAAVEGESTDGDVTIRFQAYVDDTGQPVYVDEEVMAGDYGASRDRYYFSDGRLAYFYREGSQLIAMPPDPPGLGDVVLFLSFNDDGTLDAREKRLKGRPAPMERFEVTAIVRRAEQLRSEVAYALSEPLGDDEYAGYLVLKPGLSTFQPCGEVTVYWLAGDDTVMGALRGDYESVLGDAVGQAAYARLVGTIADPLREGAASHYPAVFRVERHTALARRAERDCP